MMKTFSIGGIHPSDSKISKGCRIEVLPVPSKVYISVAQHLGAPATPVVKAASLTFFHNGQPFVWVSVASSGPSE